MEENKPEITQQYLEAIKYNDLKKEFENLGIPEVWDSKTLKINLIKNALSKLSFIKNLKTDNPEITDEEVQSKLDLINAEEQERKEQLIVKANQEKVKQQKQTQKNIAGKKLTKEQIEKNISVIDKCLKDNIKGQREILLQKRKALKELL